MEYQSPEDAVKARDEITAQINLIIDRDLSLLDQEERSIGRWFSLLGKDPEFEETKNQLDLLENLLIDTEKYLS
ncbi:MAG: hypothetical protein NE328_12580 [Lentisphaeraceae bacterium]|nr:hypothetical protein [Lentisphaeraceae bacterium]